MGLALETGYWILETGVGAGVGRRVRVRIWRMIITARAEKVAIWLFDIKIIVSLLHAGFRIDDGGGGGYHRSGFDGFLAVSGKW